MCEQDLGAADSAARQAALAASHRGARLAAQYAALDEEGLLYGAGID